MTDWRTQAACLDHDPELWWPTPMATDVYQVLAICHSCPVEATCRQWADDRGIVDGIWGGELEEARRQRLRHRSAGDNAQQILTLPAARQSRVATVAKLAAVGLNDPAIGAQIGISAKGVAVLRKRNNIPAGRPAGRPWTGDELTRLAELAADGHGDPAIGVALGRSTSAVAEVRRIHHIPAGHRAGRPEGAKV